MVFWTILFFTLSLIGLLKGGVFKSYREKLKELQLKKLNGEEDSSEWVKVGCFPLIAMSVLVVAQIVYIINALSFDPYKYPTIVALVMTIVVFVKIKKAKNTEDMSETELILHKAELVKKDHRTIKSVITSLFWTTYFGYMFYVLVF